MSFVVRSLEHDQVLLESASQSHTAGIVKMRYSNALLVGLVLPTLGLGSVLGSKFSHLNNGSGQPDTYR